MDQGPSDIPLSQATSSGCSKIAVAIILLSLQEYVNAIVFISTIINNFLASTTINVYRQKRH